MDKIVEDKKDGVIGESKDILKPIKDMSLGTNFPEMHAEGDLTVMHNDKSTIAIIDDKAEPIVEKFNKKDIPLPIVGKTFMLEGHEYTVTYINDGQHRFTCEPHKGAY